MMVHGRPNYVVRLAIQAAVSLFTSGVIYGWMSLELIFNRQGLFTSLCDAQAPDSNSTSVGMYSSFMEMNRAAYGGATTTESSTGTCAARNNYLTSIYTVGVSANIVSYLVWGVILDWLGPRITSCASIILAVLGNFLFAISNDTSRNLFHIGFAGIGVGGIGLHLASFHLANAAPTRRAGLASSIFPIIFNVSAISFPLANVLNMAGMSLSTIFWCLTVLLAGSSAALWWIQEWKAIARAPAPVAPPPLPHLHSETVVDEDAVRAEITALEVDGIETPKISAPKKEDPFSWLKFMPNKHSLPWTQQMFSWYFFWTVVWIASVLSRNAFWQGTVNRQLRSYGATSDVFAVIISWFPALILSLLPVLGPAVDKYGLPFVLAIGCVFQVVYAALALVENVPIQLVTGVVSVLSRASVMTGYFTCVSTVCGYKTFGKISGTAMAAGGLVNFTSIPLNSLINNTFKGDFFWVQVFELVWGIPLCIYPYYLWKSGKNQAIRETIERLDHNSGTPNRASNGLEHTTTNGISNGDTPMDELEHDTDDESNATVKVDF